MSNTPTLMGAVCAVRGLFKGNGAGDCIAAAVLAAQPRLEALAGPPLTFMQLVLRCPTVPIRPHFRISAVLPKRLASMDRT